VVAYVHHIKARKVPAEEAGESEAVSPYLRTNSKDSGVGALVLDGAGGAKAPAPTPEPACVTDYAIPDDKAWALTPDEVLTGPTTAFPKDFAWGVATSAFQIEGEGLFCGGDGWRGRVVASRGGGGGGGDDRQEEEE
jgi:hypothetical protein